MLNKHGAGDVYKKGDLKGIKEAEKASGLGRAAEPDAGMYLVERGHREI